MAILDTLVGALKKVFIGGKPKRRRSNLKRGRRKGKRSSHKWSQGKKSKRIKRKKVSKKKPARKSTKKPAKRSSKVTAKASKRKPAKTRKVVKKKKVRKKTPKKTSRKVIKKASRKVVKKSAKKVKKKATKKISKKLHAKKKSVIKRPGMIKNKDEDYGILTGSITHYFSKIMVCVVKADKPFRVGDNIRIKGKTTDFVQKVLSLQVESLDVSAAKKGQLVGLKVKKIAKVGDRIYKI
jgi:hypothetical protein